METISPKKLNKLQTKNSQFLLEFDDDIKEMMNHYLNQSDRIESEELELIENYLKG